MSTGKVAERDLLAKLNAQQRESVSLKWGPSLVVAGAGSGKTTVLTRRIAYLISELNQDAETILAVTFTNKAAGEMKHRVQDLVGFDMGRRLTIGTFHSVCARILRREIDQYVTPEGWKWRNNFVIYDETDSLSLIKGTIKKLNLDEKVFVPKTTKFEISSLKNDGYTCDLYSKNARSYRENKIAEIFFHYQQELARNNALDFDDLILVFTDLLKNHPDVRARQRERFRHILVDEFQDTNKAQYDLIRMIAGPHEEEGWEERSLMVVGDVDQSIYSWRKADFRIILGFQNDYKNCQLIKLEENYRSTSTVLEIANSIIENNTERLEKTLRCNRPAGAKGKCYEASDEIDEAYYVVEEIKRLKLRGRNYTDNAILYRTNSQSRAIEEVLVRNNIPYTIVGGTKFYDRQEIKDVIAYLKLVFNPDDGQSFSRVINVPRRGIGKTTLDRLQDYADEHNISTLRAIDSVDYIAEISPKTKSALKEFAAAVTRWRMLAELQQQHPVSQLLKAMLEETGYIKRLEEEAQAEKDDTALGRIENVYELVNVAQEFESEADEPDLESFLTRISLMSDLDASKMEQDLVKLMTIHSAKGLEFPVVFIMGLEEGLFPHIRSLDSPTAYEEERRLMYVAVTRAADLLYLTLARKRMVGRGDFTSTSTVPSQFLREIKPEFLTGYYPREKNERRGYDDESFGDSSDAGDWDNNSRFGAKDYGGQRNSFDRSGGRQEHPGRGYSNRPENLNRSSGSSSGRTFPSKGGSETQQNRPNSGFGGANPPAGGQRTGQTSGSPYRSGAPSASGSPYRGNNPPPAKPRVIRPGDTAGGDAAGRFVSSQSRKSEPQGEPFEHLVVGDMVQHSKFGTGTVVQVIGEKDKELYNVEFGSEKRLLDPRFAKLIKLS
jgi:DNA helicase-2/ATP-dependent DNA helicase PcrA